MAHQETNAPQSGPSASRLGQNASSAGADAHGTGTSSSRQQDSGHNEGNQDICAGTECSFGSRQEVLAGISEAVYRQAQRALYVRGWIACPEGVSDVEVSAAGGISLGRGKVGSPRPDIADKYPQADALHSGFEFCAPSADDVSEVLVRFIREDETVAVLRAAVRSGDGTTYRRESDLWNLPVPHDPKRRRDAVLGIVDGVFGDHPIDFLEIGVYKAGTSRAIFESDVKLNRYVGVDPYSGGEDDSYTGSYWQNPDGADAVYAASREIFEAHGHALLRMSSSQFFRECREDFDVVFVDGDHRFAAAYADMVQGVHLVRPGGILLMDDYGNPDTPEVTKAINRFLHEQQGNIRRMGCRRVEFQNAGKYVPVSLYFVYVQFKQ